MPSTHTEDVTGQFTLWGEVKPLKHLTRQAQFEAFDAAHPHVYRALRHEARLMLRRNHPIAAIALLSLVRPRIGCGVSNSFAPYYARKLIAEDSRFRDIIRLRKMWATAPDPYAEQMMTASRKIGAA